MNYDVEVRYMVDGCGKKIPKTRTVVVSKDGKVLWEIKTQKKIEEVIAYLDEKGCPPH